MIWPTIFLGLTFQVLLVFGARYPKNLHIWPMPESVEYGNGTIYLSKDFQLKTDGSKYADASGILKDGFTRLLDVVTANNVIESKSKVDESVLLQGIHVVVLSEDDEVLSSRIFISYCVTFVYLLAFAYCLCFFFNGVEIKVAGISVFSS